MIKIRNITKTFGSQKILHGVDLDIQKGQVVVILGPSGSGKTTFIRCLNGLEIPEDGTINFQVSKPLAINFSQKLTKDKLLALRRKSAMVFQNYNLFPHKTTLENVIEGPVFVQGKDLENTKTKAIALLNKVGLGDKLDFYPFQLSGGQQQRVGIVRALALDPELMLFDEPTSALDPELIKDVLLTMKQLANEGQTMIVVTHEIKFALEVADQMIMMDKGQIVEQGSPKELLENPKHERTKSFLQDLRDR